MSTDMVTPRLQQTLTIICLSFAGFMATLDEYIVNIALPYIARDFHVNISAAAWVSLSYFIGLTSTLLIFGKLGDKFGLKKIFLNGYVIFTIGSLLCGISFNLWMLVISRFIQGFGGAIFFATVVAMVPKCLPLQTRGRAFSTLSTLTALGVALGAPLGGVITGLLSWHWAFLINVPVGVLAFFLSRSILPKIPGENESTKQRFDFLGAILVFAGISSLVYGINASRSDGWLSEISLFLFFSAFLFLLFFYKWEKKHPNPLLDFKLFAVPHFTLASIANLMAFALIAGNNFLLPFYLMWLKGFKPAQSGLVMMFYPLTYILVTPLVGWFSHIVQPRTFCMVGMGSGLFASLIFSLTLTWPGVMPAIFHMIWLAISYALFMSPNNNLIMGIAPQDKLGISSATFKTMTNLSLALGVCFFELVFSAYAATSGFQNAYRLGALFCGLAWVFYFLNRKII